MIILGIDPGTKVMGYGAIEVTGRAVRHLQHGDLRASAKLPFLERLAILSKDVHELISQIQPNVVAVEKIFLGRNIDSAFKLGHIRGVCLSSGSNCGAQVVEYTPRAVKKGITGHGGATKEQVQRLLYAQLKLPMGEASLDASDALSLAYHHAIQIELSSRMKRGVTL